MLDGSYGLVTNQMEMFSRGLICFFFLLFHFSLRPSFLVVGAAVIHTNAVCVCVFVRISAAQLARTESSRSLGSVLKNTRATTFLYFSPFLK
jgi:hypothetical protein